MPDKLISFIIPHKGRENYLIETLDSIANQDFNIELVEIIIVTQSDRLLKAVHSLSKRISLSIYSKPSENTISSLRNYGVTQSTGEYLAFLDADIKLSSNWIAAMINELKKNTERVLVSAVQVSSANAPPLEHIRTAISNAVTDQNVNFLPGRNLFLTREIFRKSGGFPEHLITCEDYYFTDKVNHLGKLYYTSEATYIHLGEDKEYIAMYKKEIWRGQSNILSMKGRKIPLAEIPSIVIPLIILILIIVSLISLMTGHYEITFFGILLFLLPCFIYSTRLFILSKMSISYLHIFKFYLVYFPARAVGALAGLFSTFTVRD